MADRRGFRRYLRIVLGRSAPKDSIDEELKFHFDRTVEEFTERGMSDRSAREEAHRRFGDLHDYRRELLRIDRGAAMKKRVGAPLHGFIRDLGLAVRSLRREPGVAVAVTLVLGLGVGINSTMFGVIDRLLLRPPPHLEDPDAVRRLAVEMEILGSRQVLHSLTYPDVEDFRRAQSFDVAAYWLERRMLTGRGDPRTISTNLVTGDFFALTGAVPQLGRFFDSTDAGIPLAVLGYGFWRREFGEDTEAIGQQVTVGAHTYTVVGVAPEGMTGFDITPVDVWLPVLVAGDEVFGRPGIYGDVDAGIWRTSRDYSFLLPVLRLRDGYTFELAQQEATRLYRSGYQGVVEAQEAEAVLEPTRAIRGVGAGEESELAKWAGMVSLLVLAIAILNVANLLLVRGIRRRKEMGVRLALGSGWHRLATQHLAEALVLALLGAVAAVMLAKWGGEVVRAVLLPGAEWGSSWMTTRQLAFSLLAAVGAGIVAGIPPALFSVRISVGDVIKGTEGRRSSWSFSRAGLAAAQTGLSVVLLFGAGLFIVSLENARDQITGFDPERLLVAQFDLSLAAVGDEKPLYDLAAERLRTLPQAQRVSHAMSYPFGPSYGYRIDVPGVDSTRAWDGGPYAFFVDSEYFSTLGIEPIHGRTFGPDDGPGAAPVVVVGEAMANRIWPGEEALGKCIRIGGPEAPCSEVIGVVEDAPRQQVVQAAPSSMYYAPLAQHPERSVQALVIRTGAEPRQAVDAIRRQLVDVAPRDAMVTVRPMNDLIDPKLRSWKLGASLFSVFGILALAVAAIGLYSVIAFGVETQKKDMGIRSALGAAMPTLVSHVLGHGVRIAAAGVVAGVGVTVIAAPVIESLIYGISPRNPMLLLAVAVVLMITAVVASIVPAARAARVDPSDVLRTE